MYIMIRGFLDQTEEGERRREGKTNRWRIQTIYW